MTTEGLRRSCSSILPAVPNTVGDHHSARSRAYSRAMTRSAQKPLVRDDRSGPTRSLVMLDREPYRYLSLSHPLCTVVSFQ